MVKFPLVVTVQKTIIDVISVSVEAENVEDATEKAMRVAKEYPSPHEVDGIKYCYVENRSYDNVVILDVENKEDFNGPD